jgi:hypothetical protein
LLFPGVAVADTTLVAAVLPSLRAGQVGTITAVVASVINAGAETAEDVSITLVPPTADSIPPIDFSYQTLDVTGTILTGTPNTPVDIPPGGTQYFVLGLTPTEEYPGPPEGATLYYPHPRKFSFLFQGTNTPPAPTIDNVNTLLFSAYPQTRTPVEGLAIAATCPSDDGIPLTVSIPGPSRAAAFAQK